MPKLSQTGRVLSIHIGQEGTLGKEAAHQATLELDGIQGDRHIGFTRDCWAGDKQVEGTQRRNERQWSAIAAEDLAAISETMGLAQPLRAETVGVNFCLEGVDSLSRLPRGTTLQFPSGALLMVEEYNPPCLDMGEKIVAEYTTLDDNPLQPNAFVQAAKFNRGIVGSVEVAGTVSVGDEVVVLVEQLPKWLRSD